MLSEHRRERNTEIIDEHLPLVGKWLGEAGRPSTGWVVDSVAATRTAAAVAMLSHPDSGEQFVMRVASGEEGSGIERGAEASRAVRSALGDASPFRLATPVVLRHTGDYVISVETRLPGGSFAAAGLGPVEASEVIAAAITPMYRATSRRTTVTPEKAATIVTNGDLLIKPPGGTRRLSAVAAWASAQLQHSERLLGRTHGDLNLSNALFAPGDPVSVSLVDWETSHEHGMPVLDGISLVMDVRQHQTGSEIGLLVRSVLEEGYSEREARFLTQFDEQAAVDPLMMWVWWVSFVKHCLRSTPRLRSHPYWLHYNVRTVLAVFKNKGVTT